MNRMKYLIDASVFIYDLRGDKQVKEFLQQYAGEWAISFIVWGELLQGVRRKEHQRHINGIIENTEVLWGSSEIEKQAIELLMKHVHRGLGLMDALIAATAIENNLVLVTYNTKHFRVIEGLRVTGVK